MSRVGLVRSLNLLFSSCTHLGGPAFAAPACGSPFRPGPPSPSSCSLSFLPALPSAYYNTALARAKNLLKRGSIGEDL